MQRGVRDDTSGQRKKGGERERGPSTTTEPGGRPRIGRRGGRQEKLRSTGKEGGTEKENRSSREERENRVLDWDGGGGAVVLQPREIGFWQKGERHRGPAM